MPSPLALLRLLGMLLVTACLVPVGLMCRAAGRLGRERLALRGAAGVQALWARACLWGMRVRLDLDGPPPSGCYLVVANHVSYLDILVLSVLFRGRFVAKSEIAGWPFLGFLTRLSGTIFVEQARRRDLVRVGTEMEHTLAQGVRILLFPEGGASRGARIEALHSSLLETAVRGAIPCLPVALSYDTPDDPWSPASTVCWWGGMDFGPHLVGLLGLRRIRARVRWAPAPVLGSERKALAAVLARELEARFTPIPQAPIAPECAWAELFEVEPPRSSQK